MNRPFILLIILCSMNFLSCDSIVHCGSKDAFIKNYSKFTTDLREHAEKLEAQDWKAIDDEFKMYVDECYPKYKEQLSLSEKLSFWKGTLSYAVHKNGNDGNINIQLNDVKIDLADEFKDLSIESKKELEKFIKDEFGRDLEDAIDRIVDEIHNLGDELKSWLKE